EALLRISDPTSPEYGQHLSAKDVARIFEPSPNAVSGVMKWLGDSGIGQHHVKLSYGGDRLSLDLSVREAALLLETTFYHQTHQETGQEQIACQYYHIPEALAGSIDYILAASLVLTHRQIPRQQIVLNDKTTALAPLPLGCFKQTILSCLRNLYGIPEDVPPHPNNSFGVFESSWFSWLPEDLDEFFRQMQKNLVGHRPKVDAINGDYLQRNYTGPEWNQEPNLDIEYDGTHITNVQVGSYEQVGNLDDMLAAFDQYYCDSIDPGYTKYPQFYPPGCNATACDCGTSSPPKVILISWGWTEAGFTPNYLQRQCLEFLKLGLMGTTVVVSISDHGTASEGGSFCIDDKTGNATGGRFSPVFPASCPWITSVGGTQMIQPTDPQTPIATKNETTFRKDFSGQVVSSGGGFSNVFLAPPYQVPNIALYKDIEKDHLEVTLMWQPEPMNSERMHAGKGSVGFINPVLYSNLDVLNDILTGANQGCGVDEAFRATRGCDAVAGLGSPDYERMRQMFMSLP
ncbi:peptidase S8/S53 domain-containing protein, partial [Phaeosphaeriaceae sp. PMI808]